MLKMPDLLVKGEYPYWVLKYDSNKKEVKEFLKTEIPKLRAQGILKNGETNNAWVIARHANIAAKNALKAGLTVEWF